jgi:hypothetical protein
MLPTRALSGLTAFALLASRIVCLIVVAWFIVFAVNQSSGAATHQVNELMSSSQQQQPTKAPAAKEGSLKHTLNQAAKAITSPFSSLTARISSAWLAHGADTLLALLLYGFGVGFAVRLLRVRV